jgi:hypothetical protein
MRKCDENGESGSGEKKIRKNICSSVFHTS